VIVAARAYPAGLAGIAGALGDRLARRLPRLAPILAPHRPGD
jgi:hypothetical protein